jgi:hypothetical protein
MNHTDAQAGGLGVGVGGTNVKLSPERAVTVQSPVTTWPVMTMVYVPAFVYV